MAIYKYGTFSTGTTAQVQLNLGFIPSVFRIRDETIFASGTVIGVIEGYWNTALGALSTPYSMLATYTTGAPVWSRTASGSVTTATGLIPYSTADDLLFVPYNSTTPSQTTVYQSNKTTNLTITGISAAANASITATHSFTAADVGVTVVTFHGVVGMTQINTLSGIIQSVTSTTSFTVNINSSNFSTYVSGGIANVITGAPAYSLYSNVLLPTSEANLGTTGIIIGTGYTNGAGTATTDVWSYEAILMSPATGP